MHRALHTSIHLNCPCLDALRMARLSQQTATVAPRPKLARHNLTQGSRLRDRCNSVQDAGSARRIASRTSWASPCPEPTEPAGPSQHGLERGTETPDGDRLAPEHPGNTGGDGRGRDSGHEGFPRDVRA